MNDFILDPKLPWKELLDSGEIYFDKEAAQDAVDFFPDCLVHVKGKMANKPFKLAKWQAEEIIEPLFGLKKSETGKRVIEEAYVEVPRKNGKSTMGAGLGIMLAGADEEEGAEVYSAAAERRQAGIIHDIAKEMRLRSEFLMEISEGYRSSIVFPASASAYYCISAESFTKHGFNVHGVIFDELHAQPSQILKMISSFRWPHQYPCQQSTH